MLTNPSPSLRPERRRGDANLSFSFDATSVLRTIVIVGVSVGLSLLVLDLLFLGVIAKPFYDAALGALRRQPVYWPAAIAFYVMYVGAIGLYAVVRAESARAAFGRGAALGLVAYATYELTNWAVLAGWPAVLVPVDIAWGVVLTGTCALLGRKALDRWG